MNEASADSPRLVRFGVFELDVRSGELRKSGARISLQQQPLQLLSVLLEHPGELVTRDELGKRLWPDDTFVDFEHGLNAAVKRLRDALGDSADSPRFIETIPKRGYRFIATTSVASADRALDERGARRLRVTWPWVVAVVAGGALVVGIGVLFKLSTRTTAGARAESVHAVVGPVLQLTIGSHLNTEPTVSPDGEWVAYASDRGDEGHLDIWLQRLSGGEPVRLTTDAADDREPTFSADGSRIAFRSERNGGGIYVMPAHTGGEATLLVRGGAHGPRFSPDGHWLAYSMGPGRFGTDKSSGLASQTYLVAATGGKSIRLLADFTSVSWPVWSPDGRRLLLTARRSITDSPGWWVVTPDGQPPVKIALELATGFSRIPLRAWRWIEGNRIVYSTAFGGDSWDLWEVQVTPGSWVPSGTPRRLTMGAGLQAHASLVQGGRLVFSNLTLVVNVWAVPLRANSGQVVGPAKRVTATSTLQWWPAASEDGRRLVFRGDRLSARGLWLRELDNGREVLLVPSRSAWGPIITADGSRVAYTSSDDGRAIYSVQSTGGVTEKLCADCGDPWLALEDWSMDNTSLLYVTGSPAAVFVLDLRSGAKRRVLQRPPNGIWQARFSPDERWVSVLEPVFAEGRTRVWIAPFRIGEEPQADEWIAVTSGEYWEDKPRWSPDGNLLYFTSLRHGFHCIWAQRLHPHSKQPIGPAFVVHHLHNSRLSVNNTGFNGLQMEILRDKVLINLGELSGNLWTTSLQ